jgi:subtilase family serine protease
VCGTPAPKTVGCRARVATDANGIPLNTLGRNGNVGYGPADFHALYNLPTSAPSSQTIGIVDAFIDPNIEQDLATYDAKFGLAPCTQANGCLKIHQVCHTTSSASRKHPSITTTCNPFIAGGWTLEDSLDVEVTHGICQTCTILFVEAYDNTFGSLSEAESYAALNGVSAISNSWGAGEFSGETNFDSAWNHPGIATVFASGDTGDTVLYPSASPDVVAVGGTTVKASRETAWAGGGSGCSLFEPANAWQTSLPNWGATGCGTHRATADVSADAGGASAAAVYDSISWNGVSSGWAGVYGTSLAAPIIASTFALAGGTAGAANASQIPYVQFNSTNSHDITSGSNGSCGTIMCNAGLGYDGPTGLGTPNGVGGF